MKSKKSLWIGLAVAAVVIVAAAVGAFLWLFRSAGPAEILLEQDSYTVEYGEIFVVPQATCTTGEEVTVRAYDSEGYEVFIEYGTCTFEKGENKLVFSAGDLTKEVPVLCQDTTPPEVTINYVTSAAVGHKYTVPSFGAKDASGVDRKAEKIELYKGSETTPVATEVGERVVVEEADSYTLKVTVGDTEGNVATTDFPIKVIIRPETEVLQDFSELVEPYHDTWWGGGGSTYKWMEEYEGRQGVLGLGSQNNPDDGNAYAWFTGMEMDDLDFVGASKLTFRFKVDAEKCRALWFKHEGGGDAVELWMREDGDLGTQWRELTVNLVEVPFVDINHVTVGIAIATDGEGECVWLDEIVVDYRPLPEYKVTVEHGSIDYEYDEVPEGKTITVTHDDSQAPEGKAFMYWNLNGKRLYGDTLKVTEDLVFTPVYTDLVEEELAIPAGAVMVNDCSKPGMIAGDEYWGSPEYEFSWWYRTYSGRAGVYSFGMLENNIYAYARWDGLLPRNFDYDNYTHLTFRMRMGKTDTRAVWVSDDKEQLDISCFVYAYNQWTDVKVRIEDVPGFLFAIATEQGKSGEMIFVDQVYASVEPNYKGREKAIPSNAVMVEDFSNAAAVKNNPHWGSEYVGATNWYAKYDGVYGVQAFGMEGTNDFAYTMWSQVLPENFNYKAYTHITFRMKVDWEKVRAVYVGNFEETINVARFFPDKDGWVDVTVPIEKLSGMYLGYANTQAANGYAIWLDQVYVTRQEDRSKYELPLPEGAVMVEDFSDIVGPENNQVWGNGAVGITNWYEKTEDTYGVQSFGVPENEEAMYTMWEYVLPSDFDYSKYTHITLRLKANLEALRAVYMGTEQENINLMELFSQSNEWITVTVPVQDIKGFKIGISNQAGAFGEMLWIDQVWVSNEPWSVTVIDGTTDYDSDKIPDGTTITLTHDSAKTPADCEFIGWSVNGTPIEGNTVVVTENMTIQAMYKALIDELALPEGATLICDFSQTVTPHIPDSWGSGSVAGYYNSYALLDGRAGVFGMGATSGDTFMWYNDFGLNGIDLSDAATITFRMMVKSGTRKVWLKHDDIADGIDITNKITAYDQWIELTLKVADLGFADLSNATIQIRFAPPIEAEASEWIWLDQVYINGVEEGEPEEPSKPELGEGELELPNGATLICDFSNTVTPHIPSETIWGSGPAAAYYNSHDVYDGRAGVFGMGATSGGTFMWYNDFGLNDIDLSNATTITFRMMVRSGTRALWIKHDETEGIDIIDQISAFDEWIEYTCNVTDLGISNLSHATIQLRIANAIEADAGEWVWLDQVYVDGEKEITELAIPEGATLVTDFSTAAAPFNNPYYGSGAVGMTKWYAELDGVAGVQAFGITDGSATKGTLWSKVLPTDFDFSSYTTITLRFKLNKTATTAVALGSASKKYDFYALVETDNGWTTVTLNLADLPGFYLILSNAAGASGEMIWLDQVYVQ